jgi:hypothetical protein
VLGLFLYLLLPGALPLGAGEVFSLLAEAGSLWVEDDDAAWFRQNGLAFKKGEQLYVDLALGRIKSNLPWAEGAVFGGLENFSFNASRFGLDFSCGFFQHDLFKSQTEDFTVYNEGGRGLFFSARMPVHLGEWSIAPAFLYGSGSWDDGDLYWFFGKPRIPALAGYGLSLQYRGQHELAFRRLLMDMDIHNNVEEKLFDFHLDAYSVYYRFSLEVLNLRPGGTLGWFSATAGADGALTAANQHLVEFPYSFYSAQGSLEVHAGFGAVDLKQTFLFFQYHIMIGVAHIFWGEGAVDTHYKKKKLWGGAEDSDTMSLDMGGIGAAFMLLDAGLPSLRLGRQNKAQLSLGLKKLFAIPWGYEKLSPDSPASPEMSDASANELWKTILFSGLSFYASLCW